MILNWPLKWDKISLLWHCCNIEKHSNVFKNIKAIYTLINNISLLYTNIKKQKTNCTNCPMGLDESLPVKKNMSWQLCQIKHSTIMNIKESNWYHILFWITNPLCLWTKIRI